MSTQIELAVTVGVEATHFTITYSYGTTQAKIAIQGALADITEHLSHEDLTELVNALIAVRSEMAATR